MLRQYLSAETCKGSPAVGEPELAAEQFLGMLTGLIQLRALFGIPERRSAADLEKAVNRAVRIFLTAHATPHRKARPDPDAG
jgi:TetR/AcrR family transcriptional regulator, mexJK operon transcriptional repressor